ncbi:MAG: TolC family protein [Candidatus Acidiferrales bacterium]
MRSLGTSSSALRRLTQALPLALIFFLSLVSSRSCAAQYQQPQSPPPAHDLDSASIRPSAARPPAGVLHLSLADALSLARKNSVIYQAAVTDAAVAREDRAQARDALLPQINYNNQYLYTQANSTGSVRYIANNTVHEYSSQGNVHEVLDLAGVAGYRIASSAAAVARARSEVASRGLVVAVTQSYFVLLAARNKLETSRRAAEEGDRFLKLTQDLERGGESAHADVIKADLQDQDRRRQLQEAQLALLNARLDFAVLIFPDFRDTFDLSGDLHATPPLPTLAEIEQQSAHENPDVRAALAALQESAAAVTVARAGYLPALSLDYFYGIDAPEFAVNGVFNNQQVRNLGSSASVTLNIPVWNWGATRSRTKQAELHRAQAQRELSLEQRTLLSEIRSFYAEAQTSADELAGLDRSAQLASQSLNLATLRYQNGEGSILEVVDAQNSFVQDNFNYQDGAVRYRVALAKLQTLTGVLPTP